MHLPPALLITLTFALGARAGSSSSPASASASRERLVDWWVQPGPRRRGHELPLRGRAELLRRPSRKTYGAALLSCLTACPAGLPSTVALVENFCAAARKPTSIFCHSFVTSSSSAASAASNSGVGSNTMTAPATSLSTPSNAARRHTTHPLDSVAPTAAHVLLATPPRHRAPIVLPAPPCPCSQHLGLSDFASLPPRFCFPNISPVLSLCLFLKLTRALAVLGLWRPFFLLFPIPASSRPAPVALIRLLSAAFV
ncbi:hypothetical protein FB451DRAFT_1418891 [Mycena latifolia]|nr:hypothetical protein FB451DRAFT_1418891 [Mycena latifolia]